MNLMMIIAKLPDWRWPPTGNYFPVILMFSAYISKCIAQRASLPLKYCTGSIPSCSKCFFSAYVSKSIAQRVSCQLEYCTGSIPSSSKCFFFCIYLQEYCTESISSSRVLHREYPFQFQMGSFCIYLQEYCTESISSSRVLHREYPFQFQMGALKYDQSYEGNACMYLYTQTGLIYHHLSYQHTAANIYYNYDNYTFFEPGDRDRSH